MCRPPTKIPLVLASLDAFVSTSRWEGSPTAVKRLLLNRPVVLFETDGVREVIVDGVNDTTSRGHDQIMASALRRWLKRDVRRNYKRKSTLRSAPVMTNGS